MPKQIAAAPIPLLVDEKTCAALGSVSSSWWRKEVREGRAPQPAFRGVRCTRWRTADVMEFWSGIAKRGNPDGAAASATKSARANAVKQAKRASKPSEVATA